MSAWRKRIKEWVTLQSILKAVDMLETMGTNALSVDGKLLSTEMSHTCAHSSVRPMIKSWYQFAQSSKTHSIPPFPDVL